VSTAVVERSLAPQLSLVDVLDDLIWNRDGTVTLLYRMEGVYHEAGMSEEDFDQAAFAAENALATLPEGTSYQFFVLVDHLRARRGIEAAWPPIPPTDETSALLEELRTARVDELVRIDQGLGQAHLVQERRHYMAATFRPRILQRSWLDAGLAHVRRVFGVLRFAPPRTTGRGKYERSYERIMAEAATFDRRVTVSLLNMGLGFRRCQTSEMVQVLYELLNPTTSRAVEVSFLSERARFERDRLPRSIVEEFPFLADASPICGLVDDDVLVRREYLKVGDQCVSVVSLKQLPDRTEPGALVGLLRLPRKSYRLCYRIDIPKSGVELAELRARATLAAGLQLKDMLVKSDRTDPHASAVERQASTAMDRVISSTQRILGTSLQVVLSESSLEALDEAVEETLAVMGRVHGLRGYRETYMLREIYLSLLPGAPMMTERRKRTLTPNAVDLLPIFDFRSSEGKVPFLTPSNAVLWYDAFDSTRQANANILISGTSGSGKSVAACTLILGHEIGCATRGEPRPYVFFLDNGQSYRRYMECRPGDARYVTFSFSEPPGVDIWSWNEEEEPLEEHVSRLELLILDLLKVNTEDEERFERIKGVMEKALLALYRGPHPRNFHGFAERLRNQAIEDSGGSEAAGLLQSLYPFTDGKFKRLFEPNPKLAMRDDVHAICFDFRGLGEHKDLMSIALRLVIYVVRRWSARVSRKRHGTFLVLDESWAMLDAGTRGSSVAGTAAPFLASSIRMGRKEGLSVIALSQQVQDFALSAYGAAILGNSATFLIGHPGGEGVEGLRKHFRLTERQCQQVRGLRKSDRWHEFLLIRGEESTVVRVVLDSLARWVFTTSPKDRDRLAALAEARPELCLMDRLRLLAGEAS
jgi:hypothetical protein